MTKLFLGLSSSRTLAQRTGDRSRAGVALLTVLSFLALLSVLLLVFFSSSVSQRRVSNSHATQMSVDMLGSAALNTVISDLKAEIVSGSTVTSTTGGSLYFPSNPRDAVPSLSGTVNSLPFPPNLLKLSGASPVYTTSNGSGSIRGTTSLTSTNSLNGRSISAARWNKPLLLPLLSSGSLTPATSGTANGLGAWALPSASGTFSGPSWVLQARDGSNPTTWSTSLQWSDSNASTVVGRYAYAIYDEGGLLDINVAGYPSTAASGTLAAEIARKGALAFADLTQLPLTSGTLSQSDVDRLIAWRNVATGTSGSNYIWAVRGNTNGFLTVGTVGSQADRRFISRQSLIKYLNSSGSLSVSGSAAWPLLQYMGTFSRGLEQPSYAPPSTRPLIVPPSGADDGGSLGFARNYRGGNDGYGGDDSINPKFLQIVAKSSFTRNDGTTAVIGEPLVLKRFALSRLAWLTYAGPITLNGSTYNSALPASFINGLKNSGFTDEFLLKGTPTNIYNYFGLKWISSTSDPNWPGALRSAYEPPGFWVYNHGLKSTGTPSTNIIGTLSQAATANREPDFFELLKAGMNAGSLGKSSDTEARASYCAGYYYHLKDRQLDPHIIQIGANIIDQFDSDGYPTRIVYDNKTSSSGPGNPAVLRGTEDLPYIYRVRLGSVRFADPNPTTVQAGTIAANWKSSFNPGCMIIVARPEVWNPHNPSSTAPSPAPTTFRTYAESAPPDDNTLMNSSYLNLGIGSREGSGGRSNLATSYTRLTASGSFTIGGTYSYALGGTNNTNVVTATGYGKYNSTSTYQLGSELTFSNSSSLFREPTLLSEKDVPAGTNLSAGSSHVITLAGTFSGGAIYGIDPEAYPGVTLAGGSAATKKNHLGFVLGEVPIAWFSSGTSSVSIVQAANGSQGQCNFNVRLQYVDYAGQNITYSECYVRQNSGPSDDVSFTSASPIRPRWISYDPRTSRFAYPYITAGTANLLNQSDRPGISQASGVSAANGWTGRSLPGGLLSSNNPQTLQDLWHLIGWYLPGNTNYNPSGIRTGDLSQNVTSFNSVTLHYYSDADGIVRRAKGAYSTSSSSDGLPMVTSNNASRPIVLNRPFRSVAELGYVFRDVPWKHLDFYLPETGDGALLDVFCISEPQSALVAGKVNLNTRQAPVLKALLSKTLKDEFNSSDAIGSDLDNIANTIVARISSSEVSKGPLTNVSELAGKLVGLNVSGAGSESYSYTISGGSSNGTWTYSGVAAELTGSSGASTAYASTADNRIKRRAEAAVRGLTDVGQTRVWNLLIDLVSQTGKYPATASGLDQFVVEGEKRYWLHIAIDRLTGKVLDSSLETVAE